MIVLAHIMAMPVEEVLVPLASGAGAGMAIWFGAVLRRFRSLDAEKVGAAIGVTGEGVEPLG